jgi:hypothetical protein
VWPKIKAADDDTHKPSAELALLLSAPALGHAVYRVTRLSDSPQPSKGAASAALAPSAAKKVIQMPGNGSTASLSNEKLQLTVEPSGSGSVRYGSLSLKFNVQMVMYLKSFPGEVLAWYATVIIMFTKRDPMNSIGHVPLRKKNIMLLGKAPQAH